MMRKVNSVNFDWYFVEGFDKDYLDINYDFHQHESINIPHTMKLIPEAYFNEETYQFVGTYFKELEIENISQELWIEFKGVAVKSEIYLNGELLFENKGSYLPFKVNLSERIHKGKNILIAKVDSKEVANIPPFGGYVDYLGFSGIYREVSLIELGKTYLSDVKVSTDNNWIEEGKFKLNIDFKTSGFSDKNKVVFQLIDNDNLIFETEFKNTSTENNFILNLENIEKWDLNNPKLYEIKFSLLDADKLLDELSFNYGFRTAKFTTNGFYLNNELTKLVGLNRHQSYPYIGYAAPKSLQEKDADIVKALGCNIVRTSHYPQSEHFLNRADEIGLLVFEEIPGWNYIGNQEFKELTYDNIKKMIERDYHHPSIILWGVRINESKDDDEFYRTTNKIAHSLDLSRQTGGIRNFKKSHFFEDVYTYNDFSHYGNNIGLEKPKKVTGKNVPYLVTESNGHMFPTKAFDSEKRRIEQLKRHLAVLDANMKHKKSSGAISWCLADYNTHFNFGSNDHICHHGVLDINRIEKYAAYAYKSQKITDNVLFVASNLIPGDYDEMRIPEFFVLANCDYLKVYRDNKFIGKYLPDKKIYPNLKNPPFIIDDLIGDLLIENEGYDKKVAKKIKTILLSYNKFGFKLSLKAKLNAIQLMMFKKFNFTDIAALFSKYLAFQEQKPVTFKFEAYRDDQLVNIAYKSQMVDSEIQISPDKLELNHIDSYDIARVVIKQVDQFGNVLDYGKAVVEVIANQGLEIIGPKYVSLSAGTAAIYLKTTGERNKSSVKFKFADYPEREIDFKIKTGILD
jgi:beta-galactosidase